MLDFFKMGGKGEVAIGDEGRVGWVVEFLVELSQLVMGKLGDESGVAP